MDPLISIIIPVYNVEKYLKKCVESVISQSYDKLEIILVDDESKDSSGKMCDEFAAKDCRIKVIHKKNQGLGFARNSGLNIAAGDYIMLIDSDDFIETGTIEKLIKYAKLKNADVYYYGHYDVYENNKIRAGSIPDKREYYGSECLEILFLNALGLQPPQNGSDFAGISACCGMYKRKFLNDNNIYFTSERKTLCEDVFFNLEVCGKSKYVCIVPEYLYDYIHRDSSLTKSYRTDRFESAIYMNRMLIAAINKYRKGAGNDVRVMRSFLINILVCLKQEVIFEDINGRKLSRKNIRNICNNKEVQYVLSKYPLSKLPLKQKFFFFCVKKQYYILVYLLLKIRG